MQCPQCKTDSEIYHKARKGIYFIYCHKCCEKMFVRKEEKVIQPTDITNFKWNMVKSRNISPMVFLKYLNLKTSHYAYELNCNTIKNLSEIILVKGIKNE